MYSCTIERDMINTLLYYIAMDQFIAFTYRTGLIVGTPYSVFNIHRWTIANNTVYHLYHQYIDDYVCVLP
jgi:hypothetical protein